MAGKRTKTTVAEDSRYHDTWRLLKNTGMWYGAWSCLSSK